MLELHYISYTGHSSIISKLIFRLVFILSRCEAVLKSTIFDQIAAVNADDLTVDVLVRGGKEYRAGHVLKAPSVLLFSSVLSACSAYG